MSQKFQATVHQRDDVTFVKLAGVIDEDNELTDLVDKIGAGTCVIDLGEDCDPPGSTTCPPGSPAGAFLQCLSDCTCPAGSPSAAFLDLGASGS